MATNGIERHNLIHQVPGMETPRVLTTEKELLDSHFLAHLEVDLGKLDLSSERLRDKELGDLKNDLSLKFVSIAPDLGTFGLAKGHVSRLIDHLSAHGVVNERELVKQGSYE